MFLELSADEARALAALLAPCNDGHLRSVADQLTREFDTLADVRGWLSS